MSLPRRPIEPLIPPPDSFDRVLTTAHRRRRHTIAVATSTMVAVVLIAVGSFAVGASINASQRFDPAGKTTTTPGPTADPSTLPSATPKSTPKKSRSVAGGGKSAVGAAPPLTWLRGQAIDPDGNGIAGLYVLPGYQGGFSSIGYGGGRTGAGGYYKIPCPHAPVLLATWRLNVPYSGSSAGGPWAATFVGSTSGAAVLPRCDGQRIVTTLLPGATLTGKVIDRGDCVAGDNYHVWVYFRYHGATAIRLHGLYSGDTFTVSGLPAGTYTLGLRRQMRKVSVAAGTTTEGDVYFTCDGTTKLPKDTTPIPQETPTPEASPELPPSPTPAPAIE